MMEGLVECGGRGSGDSLCCHLKTQAGRVV
jgi:hypothetical protein